MSINWIARLLVLVLLTLFAAQAVPQQATSEKTPTPRPPSRRDGQHDFDFDIGTWKTHLRRLVRPLTGSTTWVEYEGITVVRKIWNGHANLAELVANGPAGHLEALSLRLCNSEAHQWSLNSANPQTGVVSVPAVGEFKDGQGEFLDQEQSTVGLSSCAMLGRT